MVLNADFVSTVSFVLIVLTGDLLGDFSPDDKPDGLSRVLVPTSVDSHGCFVVVGVALFVDCWIGVLRYFSPSDKYCDLLRVLVSISSSWGSSSSIAWVLGFAPHGAVFDKACH